MPNGSRPNILVLMTDQHRFDALGAAGYAHVKTPHLDALAARGALFRTCYVQNTICSPSRATYATGLYPQNHGLWANGVALPADKALISKTLADAGYDCGMAGKQHLSPCSIVDEPRLDDGYRVYRWSHDPIHRSPQNAYHHWLERNHPEVYQTSVILARRDSEEAGNVAKGPLALDVVAPEAHYSHWVAQEAIDFIGDASRPAGQPFYFMANFFDPHHPFGAPAEYRALYDAATLPGPVGSRTELDSKPEPQRRYSAKSYGGHAPGFAEYSPKELREARASYFAMVSLIDAEVGRIVETLRAAGQLDNTLIAFTSDHGEMLGDHAIMLKGPMMYEGVVRVPLILHWPNALTGGRVVDDIVQSIDLTPTLLGAAGLANVMPTQGCDLLPLAQHAVDDWRPWALTLYRDSGHSANPPIHTSMLRWGRYKLVIWHGDPAAARSRDGELYDLEIDPNELNNLYHDESRAKLREHMKDQLLDVLDATEWPRPQRTAQW